jgi:hypothetical protein
MYHFVLPLEKGKFEVKRRRCRLLFLTVPDADGLYPR